jgi:hypothetical protein
MGGVAEFFIGTPAIIGLALGIAGAVSFGLDPLGAVWRKSEDASSIDLQVSVDNSPIVGEAPARP